MTTPDSTRFLPRLDSLTRWIPAILFGMKEKADGMPGTWIPCDILPETWRVELIRDPRSRRYAVRWSVISSAKWGWPAFAPEARRLTDLIGFTNQWREGSRTGEGEGDVLTITFTEPLHPELT